MDVDTSCWEGSFFLCLTRVLVRFVLFSISLLRAKKDSWVGLVKRITEAVRKRI